VGAVGTIQTDGRNVGLPDGQFGNSEVGHLNIGAGRVVLQDSTRINDAVQTDALAENEVLVSAFDHADSNDGHTHLMGLVSDGGVHSSQAHLHALIRAAADRGTSAVTHAFTDGRDTAPTGGTGYLSELESVAQAAGTGHVATVTGRYYAMDRDQNWERTRQAYDAIVNRTALHTAESAVTACEASYARGETDEFVEPTLIDERPAVSAGDSVVFFNFRADRARQLTRLLANIRPEWPFETAPPETLVTTMTEYDTRFELPVAFTPHHPDHVLGEVVAAAGLTQLRVAETEKYAHVTYFLNGGREVEFEGETRDIISSPDVPTYDLQPEMSAQTVTDRTIGHITSDSPDFLVLNYANPDMVGHTGEFDAAVAACETVDSCLSLLVPALQSAGADVLITADHGNADDIGSVSTPHTAHTSNPVPFIHLPPEGKSPFAIRDGGVLADVAPTVLSLLGLDTPVEMTGTSLLR
jgi:2,3-bisphosphoglycerate-independent phosphoglycerate mutase